MVSIPQLGIIITCYLHTPINDVASFLLDKLNIYGKLMWHSMETMDEDRYNWCQQNIISMIKFKFWNFIV